MSKNSNSVLLENSQAIPLNLHIAKALGVCQALLLQQIHYYTTTRPVHKEGRGWCYYTHEEWAKHIGLYDSRTIKRAMADLVKLGLIIIGRHNAHKYDRTNWYTVDYMKLSTWVGEVGVEGRVPAKSLSDALISGTNIAPSIGTKNPTPSGQNSPKEALNKCCPQRIREERNARRTRFRASGVVNHPQ